MLNAGRHSRALLAEIRQTLAQGKIWRGELKRRHRNGAGFWLDSTLIPVQDPQGRLLQLVGIHQDTTRRKQAEAALRESEARLRAIFHQAAVGIAQVRPHGHLLDVNQQLCRMLGYIVRNCSTAA